MNDLNRTLARRGRVMGLLCGLLIAAGCQMLDVRESRLPPPRPTYAFSYDPAREDVVGELQVIRARDADTFPDIARRFNIGFEELAAANPEVDPWLPGEGTEILIPTQFVLPDAPREGVVINLPAMRLYYFPRAQPGVPQRVITHPVGIGRMEWKTPEGVTHIAAKAEAPTWYPTPAIRREHAANGEPLPAAVPPGPDNPLGSHALRLGWPKYSIHGTNLPPSIGLRGTHGCVRMYPEDILRLYRDVPVGTKVRVVNQPVLVGWKDGVLYAQRYPALEEDKRDQAALAERVLELSLNSTRRRDADPADRADLSAGLRDAPPAIAFPLAAARPHLRAYLAGVERVQNVPSPAEPDWRLTEAQAR